MIFQTIPRHHCSLIVYQQQIEKRHHYSLIVHQQQIEKKSSTLFLQMFSLLVN